METKILGTEIIFISDTHGLHNQLTDKLTVPTGGSIIVHTGDMSNRGYAWEIQEFLDWYGNLPYGHKILIAGNHDWGFQDQPHLIKEMLKQYPDIYYLENSEIVIEGIKFYGSPQQPEFYNWAFNVERGEKIRNYWLQIPLDTDILITHGPPQGILDSYLAGGIPIQCGCWDLLDVVMSQVKPKVHAFGHIHAGYGTQLVEGVQFINGSMCDEDYKCVNEPIKYFYKF